MIRMNDVTSRSFEMEMGKLSVKECIKNAFRITVKTPQILVPDVVYGLYSLISRQYMPEKNAVYMLAEWSIFWFFSFFTIRLVYDASSNNLSLRNAIKVVLGRYDAIIFASVLHFFVDKILDSVTRIWLNALIFYAIFYAGIRLSFSFHAILIDKYPIPDSLKRSWRITKGNWWRTLALEPFWWLIVLFVLGISLAFREITQVPQLVIYTATFIIFLSLAMQTVFLTFGYLQLTRKREKMNGTRGEDATSTGPHPSPETSGSTPKRILSVCP